MGRRRPALARRDGDIGGEPTDCNSMNNPRGLPIESKTPTLCRVAQYGLATKSEAWKGARRGHRCRTFRRQA